MAEFTAKIKESVKKYNESNPDKREVSMTSLAEKIGCTKQYLSQINTIFKEQLNLHFSVIFMSEDKDAIRKTWEQYLKLKSTKLIQRINSICIELNIEVWDLIVKKEE